MTKMTEGRILNTIFCNLSVYSIAKLLNESLLQAIGVEQSMKESQAFLPANEWSAKKSERISTYFL